MKVSDIMQRQIDFVDIETPLSAVARLIFGRGINSVPVCKGKKVVGFITESDILAKFYPSVQEYIEDPIHSGDFEAMENKIDEILQVSAREIMSSSPATVIADTPVLRAQSTMKLKNVSRLAVVDHKDNLIGILSKGDIFRAVVGDKLPFEQDEKFHDWLSRRYDTIIDWKTRLEKEIPDLVSLFKKENVKSILDFGCGTGMHAIALAKEGYNVVGIDRSSRMIYESSQKLKALPDSVRQRLKFVHTEYKNLNKVLSGVVFDAAMSMGAGLAHTSDPSQVLKEVNRVIKKRAVFVCQMPNYEKIIKLNKRLYDFAIKKSPYPEEREQAFLRFYDPNEEGFLTLNMSVFTRGKKKWVFRGFHSMPIVELNKEGLTSLFKKIGFSNMSYYGEEKGFYYDYLFRIPFNPTKSDVLVVVAKRQP